jgi:hypothetical protein
MNTPTIKPEWLVGITMTQAQKDYWLTALRNGEYPQGRMGLLDEHHGGYCCLGVAAVTVLGVHPDRLLGRAELTELGCQSFLGGWPRNLFWASDPETYEGIQQVLAGMNDSGRSFAEIADFIEAHIPACDAAPI